MAKKNTVVVVKEMSNVEDILANLNLWADAGSEGRAKAIKANGENERRIVKEVPQAKIYFYDTGAVYVRFSPGKSIKLWRGFNPVAIYSSKAKGEQRYDLVWNYDVNLYSVENKTLANALGAAFAK